MTDDPKHTDRRFRSLLQKAVRRGYVNLVFTTCAILEGMDPKEKNWLRKRAVSLTFEICWPLCDRLNFNKRFYSKVAALAAVAGAAKHRDAAGLGSLALALSAGDRSVLLGPPHDRDVRILSKAARHPDDYWKWILSLDLPEDRKGMMDKAFRWKNIGRTQERIITQAAAYLAAHGELKPPETIAAEQKDFPYWVALDKGTREGSRALKDIARDLHIPLHQLEWTLYFFESGKVTGDRPSNWWDRYCRWRFSRSGIPLEEARLLWDPVVGQLKEALAEDALNLHKDVYRWKMAHMERVETLKKQVKMVIENPEELEKSQRELF